MVTRNKKLVLLLALLLPVGLMAAGCSSTPDATDSTSSQVTAAGGPDPMDPPQIEPPPSNATAPALEPPLESHPGDEDKFYADTDDYVVWAKPSTHTEADWEYRVVSFDASGLQTSAFMKYVFSDEAGAKEFAETDARLIQVGNVVYYQGWLGSETPDKAGVIAVATADGNEFFISKPS